MTASTILSDYIGYGLDVNRPTTPPVGAGISAMYFATDTKVAYIWTGVSWQFYSGPTYYGGANNSVTYDPGVSYVVLNGGCSITLPASARSRVFLTTLYVAVAAGGSHGIHMNIGLDSVAYTTAAVQTYQIGTEPTRTASLGPMPVTIPGDSAAHTLQFWVADAGATGNLTFYERYISATQVA